jgi:hypothetical protein
MHHTTSHTRAIVATSSGATTQGTLEVLEFSEQGRMKRALIMAAKCLGITALCVAIPGAHFILVPLGLIVVTPLMALYTFRVKTKIVAAKIECPKCHAQLNVLSSQENYPMYENCSSCHRQVSITHG